MLLIWGERTMSNGEENKVKVFVSCKEENYPIAKKIINKLDSYDGAYRLEFFLAEDIKKGDDWQDAIDSALDQSDLFLLLLMDESADLNWCLYEAGRFGDGKPMICLHAPDTELPDPLRRYQSLKIRLDDLKDFLKEFFGETRYYPNKKPLNKKLAINDNEIKEIGDRMCEWFYEAPSDPPPTFFGYYLVLRIHDPDAIVDDIIPADAEIVETDSASMKNFELEPYPPGGQPPHWKWSDILNKANRPEDELWIAQLARAISQACKGYQFDPIQGCFMALDSGKIFLPVLRRRLDKINGEKEFLIMFVEQISWGIVGMDEELRRLIQSMIIGRRFRWEIIEPYLKTYIPSWENTEPQEPEFERLTNAISYIEQEAAASGVLGEEKLLSSFRGEQKITVKKLLDEWKNLRGPIYNAITSREIKDIKRYLETLRHLNNQFMVVAAERFLELHKSFLEAERKI
jgi:hypothetical protein